MVRTESVIVRDNIRASQPTVLLIVGTEPLEPLLTFFREKCMSLSAERSYAQAVGRFVEWLSVRAGEFYAQDQRNLVTSFVMRLLKLLGVVAIDELSSDCLTAFGCQKHFRHV